MLLFYSISITNLIFFHTKFCYDVFMEYDHISTKFHRHPYLGSLSVVGTKDKNIGNHGYIGNLILRIYRISEKYQRIFWKKILISKKLIKTHKNVKKNLIIM